MSTLRSLTAAALLGVVPFAFAQDPARDRVLDSPAAAAPRPAARANAPARAADHTPQDAQPAAIKVGVVDLIAVRDVYDKWIRMQGELEEKRKGYNSHLGRISKELDELKGRLELYQDPQQPERRALEFQLESKMAERRFFAKSFTEQDQIDTMRCLLDVYQDIEVAVGRIAARKGVHLVLRKHDPSAVADTATLNPTELEARFMRLDRQQVWYSAKEIDLTGDVIKLLQAPLAAPASDAPKPGAGNGGD